MAREARPVRLSAEERQYLEDYTRKGTAPVRSIRRAQILLLVDEHRPGGKKTLAEVAHLLGVTDNTISQIKRTFCIQGLEATLQRKKRETPPILPKVTGDVEARIIAISCSKPPEGRARWTMRMIAERVVELEIVDSLSQETVRQLLKKTK